MEACAGNKNEQDIKGRGNVTRKIEGKVTALFGQGNAREEQDDILKPTF